MRKLALTLLLAGLLVVSGLFTMSATTDAGAEPADEGSPTRTDPFNKQTPYPQWSGWDDENYKQPWNQRWHNWTNYLQYYPQTEFWLRCKNMTEDYQWLDDVNFTTNGDEPGLAKEDLNTTQTEDDPMNFSYPRSDKKMTAKYDTTMNDLGVLNITANPLGLISPGTNPLMGRLKEINVAVWVDTNGDYNYQNPDPNAAIEGIMQFDFNWWDTPYDPTVPGYNIEPYVTNSSEMWKTQRQMEESADGLGYWLDLDDDGRPNVPGDITKGRIWVLIWRSDTNSDDLDNRTMDLLLYCGYTGKQSWISLPFLHPKQLPVADTGSDIGWPANKDKFQLPESNPYHAEAEFDEDHPQIKEGEKVFLDGRRSYDPQDDVGADGLGYGNPDWTGADIGEGNENIDDGNPPAGETEQDLGEVDHLKYKWAGETSISGNDYKLQLSPGFQSSPVFEWQVRLPAVDNSLPAEKQFLVVNITLTVKDTDNFQDTHTIQLLAYKSQSRPVVSLTVLPQIPKAYSHIGEAYVLPQQEVIFQGYAYDRDPNSELNFYWLFVGGPYNTIIEYEVSNIITQSFDEVGDWIVTLTVYDGPLDNINTLNGSAVLNLHVIDNNDPEPVIRASHTPPEKWQYEHINTSKGRTVYFNGSESYDPDVYVTGITDIDDHWEGLPGFDENADGIPDITLKYQWDWGDGTRTESFSSDPQAEHKWQDKGSVSTGKKFWPVKLKVWDGRAIIESEPFIVYVNLPPTAEAGPNRPMPEEGEIEVGMPVSFSGIGAYDPNDDANYDGKRDSEYKDTLSYFWDFGDGSKEQLGREISHTYSKPGTFEVRLTVKDREYSATDTLKVKIIPANLGPVGVVTITADSWKDIDAREVYTLVAMDFDATQSYDPDGLYYLDDKQETNPLDDLYGLTWNLGDDFTTAQPKTDHTFTNNGVYTIKINMSDSKGAKWEENYTITVINRLPVPVLGVRQVSYYMSDQPVMLSGDGSYDLDGKDGLPIGYYWDYGDGTHSPLDKGIEGYQTSKVTSHQYQKPGRYTVKLWCMDDDHEKTPEAEAATMEVRIVADKPTGPVPFPLEFALAGIAAALIALSIASTYFIRLRKRL